MQRKIFTSPKWLLILMLFSGSFSYAQTVDFIFSATDSAACAPYRIIFNQNCTGNPIGYIWNFGNGERGSNSFEVIVYTAGTYTITLTAIYADKAMSASKTITVNPSPTLSLSADKNNLCSPGAVQFAATGSSFITQYQWNFGDSSAVENTATATAAHSYTNFGNYTATLKATTAQGCSASQTYSVAIQKFNISGSIINSTGCIPAAASLHVSSVLPAGERLLNYSWNFGDGTVSSVSTDSSINHSYNTTDSIYTSSVLVKTSGGCSNSFTFQPFAFGTPPVNTVIKTAAAKDSFCGSEKIKFYAKAVNASSYKWDFGDGAQISIADTMAVHKYRTLGKKTIVVTPFFNGCEGAKDSITIFIKGVIANFDYSNLCSSKEAYQFIDLSLGHISHFTWAFSDNNTTDSTHQNIAHNFPLSGSFNAALSLADNISGCTDTTITPIYTAVPSFSSSAASVCKDSLISYQVSNTYPDAAGYNYIFHVNGYTINNGRDSVLKYYPATHGSFANFVVIKDGLTGTCDDTLRLSNTIVKGPVVDFTTAERLCVNKAFSFANSSQPYYPAETITTWQWSFGDNTTNSSKIPPAHFYAKAGAYTVRLTATDINGCAQTIIQTVSADRLPQITVFPAMDTICQGRDTAVLSAYTTDVLLWMPATTISCTTCDTTHVTPLTTTTYIAQATNWQGCKSYDTSIVKVFAPFRLSISPADIAICPGTQVSLKLNVPGITTWLPSVNSRNNLQQITVTPSADMVYKAIVQDSAGCYSDSASSTIRVFAAPSVDAGPDRIVAYNSSFTITPVYSHDVTNYLWEPIEGETCNNCPTISGVALKTTTYTIKTSSENGCISSDKITLFISCENANLLLPTAFTPNGNGRNDYFFPNARGYRTIRKFMIFNRMGFKVFERQNFAPNIASLGWDGSIKTNEPAGNTETFAWFIEAECEQGEVMTTKGTVVLIR